MSDDVTEPHTEEEPPGTEGEAQINCCHCLTAGFGPAGMGPMVLAAKHGLAKKLLQVIGKSIGEPCA
jgi:hypothetical protein